MATHNRLVFPESTNFTSDSECSSNFDAINESSHNSSHLPDWDKREERDRRSIFVGQVEYSATEDELKQHFQGCGSINHVTIRRKDGKSIGCAYIEFAVIDSVNKAKALEKSVFNGRTITVAQKRTNLPRHSTTGKPRASRYDTSLRDQQLGEACRASPGRGGTDAKKEVRETRHVINLQKYETDYLSIANTVSELKDRHHVKDLFLDISQSILVIHGHKSVFDAINTEIEAITSSLCEESITKSHSFVKKCELARMKIVENFKAHKILAAYVTGQNKLVAYARTKEAAQKALECIEEMVWEVTYPVGRKFNDEEERCLEKNERSWQKVKDQVNKAYSVTIVECSNANFVVTGCEKFNQYPVIRKMDEFFKENIPKSTFFNGKPSHIEYISRYMSQNMEMIENFTKAKVTCKSKEISIFGTDRQRRKSEKELRDLHDKIVSGKHTVDVDYHIQFLLSNSEIIKELGEANRTLIILENGLNLRKDNPASNLDCHTSHNETQKLNEIPALIGGWKATGIDEPLQQNKVFLETIKKGVGQNPNEATPTQQHLWKSISQAASKVSSRMVMSNVQLSLSNTKITLSQGDILLYTGKAIVCSTNRRLSMGGAVAEKLTSDLYIKKQIEKADSKEMQSEGICLVKISTSEVDIPNYKAEFIILVDSNSPPDSIVRKCLEKCQNNRISSIAFPFIGTGKGNRGLQAELIAKELLTAAIEYVHCSHNGALKDIDFIAWEDSQFQTFRSTFNDVIKQRSMFCCITGTRCLSGSDNADQSTAAAVSIGPYEESNALHMIIYGLEIANIESTKDQLNVRLKKETASINSHNWENKDLIPDLLSEKIANLSQEAKRRGINFIPSQNHKDIKISGRRTAVDEFADSIKQQLQDIRTQVTKKNHDEFQLSSFIWQYSNDKEKKWTNFFWEDSHQLESTYKQNPDAEMEFYSVEFKESLKIYLHTNSFELYKNVYLIRRINKTFPHDWDYSYGEQAEVPLDEANEAYKKVEANFKKTIGIPNVKILKIERVQHLTAYNHYMEERRSVAKALRRPEEQVERVPLWHGSNEDAVRKIAMSFFNRSYSGKNATAYGEGCYFATNAKYSADDKYSEPNAKKEKYMFQARVIVGDFTKGTPAMIDRPPKTDGTLYDSVVNDVMNPTIFVVFKDTAAYPEYIIKFKIMTDYE